MHISDWSSDVCSSDLLVDGDASDFCIVLDDEDGCFVCGAFHFRGGIVLLLLVLSVRTGQIEPRSCRVRLRCRSSHGRPTAWLSRRSCAGRGPCPCPPP